MVKRSHYLKGITIMANLETKLKALLAAGLIGTAGLGMQSCSNPSDSVYYPYTVEAPSTDNPGSGGGTENPGNGGDAETSNPSGGEENGDNGVETVDEVTFSDLGVTDTDMQAKIVSAYDDKKIEKFGSITTEFISNINRDYIYVYINSSGFVDRSNITRLSSDYNDGAIMYRYKDTNTYGYIIPKNMEGKFTAAIKAFNK